MEYIQIILNIAVLGGIAWFVFREAGGKYADRRVVRELRDDFTEFHEAQNDWFTFLNSVNIDSRLSSLEEKPIFVPPLQTDTVSLIQLGSDLAERNIKTGSQIVTDALVKDGRLVNRPEVPPKRGPINIDEFATEIEKDDESGLPELIRKQNEKMAADLAVMGLKGVERNG